MANAVGLPCALLSLASGAISLTVAFIVWWRQLAPNIRTIGIQAGIFSALMGLGLAAIAAASGRRRVRGLAIIAIAINVLVLSFSLDQLFHIVRW